MSLNTLETRDGIPLATLINNDARRRISPVSAIGQTPKKQPIDSELIYQNWREQSIYIAERSAEIAERLPRALGTEGGKREGIIFSVSNFLNGLITSDAKPEDKLYALGWRNRAIKEIRGEFVDSANY